MLANPSAHPTLTYPLTKKALLAAFEPLRPAGVELTKRSGWHEASIDGAWSLRRLRSMFRSLGFRQTGPAGALLFVNDDQTLGLQCMGVDPHPTRNTWKTYSIEVQARRDQRTERASLVGC